VKRLRSFGAGWQGAAVCGRSIQDIERDALRRAQQDSETDVSAALRNVGWPDLLYADEASFYTALFEEHGYLGACTNALDIVAAAMLDLDGRGAFVWPLESRGDGSSGRQRDGAD
jgi:hypothetical protein